MNIKINKLEALIKNENLLIEKQEDILNDIEKKISNYLSLGHKTTKTNSRTDAFNILSDKFKLKDTLKKTMMQLFYQKPV